MACNCKQKYDKIAEKYGDKENVIKEKESFLFKIFKFIIQFLFGIFAGCIIIVMLVPMVVYIIFCLITGLQPHFRLYNVSKRINDVKNKFKRNKNELNE